MFNIAKQLFIEVTVQEIRFLYWERGLWGKSVISFQSFPHEVGDSEINILKDKSTLEKILKDYRLNTFGRTKMPVSLLIPFQNGLIRDFRLPWIIERERDSAVHYFLQNEIPVLADELIYNYQVIEEKENEFLSIKVIAVRKDVICAYAQCLEQAGYTLRSVKYSVLALGEILGVCCIKKRILCLQGLRENKIQLVLFKDGLPEVIRELSIEQDEIAKHQIFLGLQDYELPVDFAITDGSILADKVFDLLMKSGLVKEQLNSENNRITFAGQLKDEFRTYALLGELKRVKGKKSINFYSSFLRPLKVKTIAFLLGVYFIFFLLAGSLLWYPRSLDYWHTQEKIVFLRDELNKLEIQEEEIAWFEYKKKQEVYCFDLGRIQKALEQVSNDMNLIRLNYKQNNLYIWAECMDNTSITKIIGFLTAEGWREPIIMDYKYQQKNISFCISVKG
jgi:hypothetical protein